LADDKDVFGRADALLRRNAAAHAANADPAAVPVLTDLVGDPPDAADELSSDIAREVFARVLAEVEGRLANDLEKRVADHLAGQVHTAVAAAVAESLQRRNVK
jgi:hypothetical protein